MAGLGKRQQLVQRLVPTYEFVTVKTLQPLLSTSKEAARKMLKTSVDEAELKTAEIRLGQQKLYHAAGRTPGGNQAIAKHFGALSFCAYSPIAARRIPRNFRDQLGLDATEFARHPLALATVKSEPWLFCVMTQVSPKTVAVKNRLKQIAKSAASGEFEVFAQERRLALAVVLRSDDDRDDIRHHIVEHPLPKGLAAYLHVEPDLRPLIGDGASE